MLQLLILGLVGWGIYRSFEASRAELSQQRLQILGEANELRLQASKAENARSAQELLAQSQALQAAAHDFWKANPLGLAFAGVLYGLGMIPAGLYWKRCLSALGQQTELMVTLWAYFYGNLGKYFPGKAMVLIIRLRELKRFDVNSVAVTVAIFMETLTLMATGAAMAALCLIALNIDWRLTILALGLLAATFLPIIPPLIRWIVSKIGRVPNEDLEQWKSRTGWKLTGVGWLSLSLSWMLFGLSLLVVLLSIPGYQDLQVSQARLVASACGACALAVVSGFVSLIPGGAGVREVVVSMILAPVVGPTTALCGAVWMRVVWTTVELLIAGCLGTLVFQFRPVSAAMQETADGPGKPARLGDADP
ncbi:MAG: flippase-like domain-containing protein [Planctomycetales bacterium]|nr:flippase-like domain-containing protein [Planctomycetales bacterium]